MQYGLIGAKLGHSYSPAIHAQLSDYDYRLCELTEDAFVDLMKSRGFKGLNVTIPYKVVAFNHCDALSDVAREVGCVNTLIARPDGTLYGHNTDIGGFIALSKRAGVVIAGKKCAILGSGGTSLTARTACRRLGAREVVIVSRSGPVDYEALYRDHADVEVLVNTTPVGMYPNNGRAAADISRLPNLTGVLDVVYNPDKTALILDAEARGLPCAGGLYMLVGQAREAAALFMGRDIPESETDRIYGMLRAEALNVVLVGMPGSGKTSVGEALARRMGREYVDCDAEIVKRAGMSIPDIFASQGEAGFRDLEARVIADVCREKSRVVATGGGAVLRDENVRAMRQNGVVLMLARDIDALPMDGRPLSSGREALRRMWTVREPKYRAAADACIDNDTTIDAAVTAAMEAYHEAAHR
ncbi:MAG: hypothetical protein IJ646_04880 [Clostridia bacterium]|nr:hypothetical protein [Clostridia bacterium]